MIEYLQRMARYNRWMNRKLYAKVQQLSADEIAKDRGAFFDSILGTLNHILVGDMFWLRRFAGSKMCAEALAPIREMPTDTIKRPTDLRDFLYDDIQLLASKREELDQLILAFSQTWSDEMLASPFATGTWQARSMSSRWACCCNTSSITRPIIADRSLRCSSRQASTPKSPI